MTGDPYGDEQLVQLYDLDNPAGEDHEYYRALAERTAKVLDFGCGTGLLTRSLVASGREVIGIDPSPTMLGYARRQPGADAVTWIDGDHRVVQPTGDVDLVVSSGNTMMHVAEHADTVAAVAAALRPGGVFAFESRNPAVRAWEQWTSEATYGERDTVAGHLKEWLELIEIADRRVVFDAHNVFEDGHDAVYRNVLYFRSVEEITADLRAAGFSDVVVDGGWHGEPLAAKSRLLVVRATK
ncbi:2-polyprenyl-3-methyl-5-hydroxy-6-metoxy-1,4-benzoquinol methylase [Kribbella aluminosa]|uniref:2-polyprenyl-3-methyl-5-hydroxy-6-metoxy-1, 4-benzoquinol methylase n=1 Tax=Kribbella aluminosa TaxID=416017 RepID=A0ABS4UHT9_9ACTN|nr:class I SAM-dependent methyltransferase [Kribbella aluminosa]MBP2351129.1 2-polyprenyl-3-methyl-5-hydroxy-6-metoxy-1,4-benzoquinol methylase [Kribbella aluminosa]